MSEKEEVTKPGEGERLELTLARAYEALKKAMEGVKK